MIWKPKSVRTIPLTSPAFKRRARAAAQLDHPAIVKRIGQNPEVVVGVMGDPSRATVDFGESIAREAVEGRNKMPTTQAAQ